MAINNSIITKKYNAYKNKVAILNKIAERDYSLFSVCGRFFITNSFDPKTLIDRIIKENPMRILMSDKIFDLISSDNRISIASEESIALTGSYGRINNIRISCFSKQLVNGEYKILLYRDKKSRCSSIVLNF